MNLSSNLKEYLSKSKSSSGNDRGSNEESRGLMSWWSKSQDSVNSSSDDVTFDETTTGWFNQAQKDPCLPTLVSHVPYLTLGENDVVVIQAQ